ncbi:MAG TPA: DnaB-like helicase N-terminal domain-containing protein, partial [Burkholderiales bacterium]|nr:DnaB-like helicase N-terminal domain-containing protein [Burkholderiales bacterium]
MSASAVGEDVLAGLGANGDARQPVADIQAEQYVLGALLTDTGALERVRSIISSADLYRHEHRLIFAAVEAVAATGATSDIVTVQGHLEVRGELNEAGGLAYLGELAYACITTAGLEAWASQIAGKARRRDIAALGAVLTERAVIPGEDLDVLTADVSEALIAIMRRAQPASAPPDVDQFLAIDFPPPDPLIGPIRCQQSVLCAAAPGVGKTHLLTGMANALLNGADFMHWRVPAPRSVLFIDGELPGSELQARLRAYRWPRGGPEFRIVNATNWVSSCGLSHPNIADLAWQARVNEWAQGVDVVMLDNVMSLLSVPGVSMSEDTFWKPAHDFTLRQRAAGRTVIWADHLNAQGKVFG